MENDESFGYDVSELTETNKKEEIVIAKKDPKIEDVKFTMPQKPVVQERKIADKKPQEWEKIDLAKKLNSEFNEKDIFSSHKILNAGAAKISDFGGPNTKRTAENSIFNPNAISKLKEMDEGTNIKKINENKIEKIKAGKKEWEDDAAKGSMKKETLIRPSGHDIGANWSSARIAKNQLSIFDIDKLKNIKNDDMGEKIVKQNIDNKNAISRKSENKNEIKNELPKSTLNMQKQLINALLGK
jgi:hypothetical protein